MIKRILMLCAMAWWCLATTVLAGDVSVDDARMVAQNWLTHYVQTYRSWGGSTSPTIQAEEPMTHQGQTVGYNFLIAPRGHIVVPFRNELPVVKLYSETTTLSMQAASEPAQWIQEELFKLDEALDAHADELAAIDFGETPNARLWKLFSNPAATFAQEYAATADTMDFLSLGPLLTTTWSQGDPYWLQTPLWYDGRKTYTGCVATAAAQIMRFWRYPATGQGAKSYAWNNGAAYITLSRDFSASSYDWTNMTATYGSASTTAQKNAAAKLMGDVGVAFEMSYGPDGSGAYTLDGTTVFPTYFKYDSNSIQAVRRSSYASDSAWMKVFKTEAQAGRPAQFSIRDPNAGGHSVVVDGYRDSPAEQIHINMGWGGAYDAWYVSSNIATGGYTWSDVNSQAAVIGIQPATTSPSVCPSAVTLTAEAPYNGTTNDGSSIITTYNCTSWNESGPEKWHVITTASTATITATLTNMSEDLDVFILNACNQNGCNVYGNSSVTYENAPAGAYYIVVDGYNGVSGTYTLTVEVTAPTSSCSNVTTLTDGVTYSGSTVGMSSATNSYNCSSWDESGPEQWHKITTSATSTITAELGNLSNDLDVFILDSCDPNACLAYGDSTATYSNAPAGTYYIVVDGYAGNSGAYELTASTSTSSGGLSWVLWTKAAIGGAYICDVETNYCAYYANGAGWRATSYHRNRNGTAQLLWAYPKTGRAQLWTLDANGMMVSRQTYQRTGWVATSYFRSSDTIAYLLWSKASVGKASVWVLLNGVKLGGKSYQRAAGWQATGYHRNSDGTAQLLWSNGSLGRASIWTLNQSGIKISGTPYTYKKGWKATSYFRKTAQTASLLWTKGTSWYAPIWTLDANGVYANSRYAFLSTGWGAQSYVEAFESSDEAISASAKEFVIIKKAGSGKGTVTVGDWVCAETCQTLHMPTITGVTLAVTATPDEYSTFSGWQTESGKSLAGLEYVKAGDTVIAVFEKQ